VFTKNDIHSLADIVIVDPMQAYLLHQSCVTQGFVASNVVPSKEKSYRN
jgi:hypothetical protein